MLKGTHTGCLSYWIYLVFIILVGIILFWLYSNWFYLYWLQSVYSIDKFGILFKYISFSYLLAESGSLAFFSVWLFGCLLYFFEFIVIFLSLLGLFLLNEQLFLLAFLYLLCPNILNYLSFLNLIKCTFSDIRLYFFHQFLLLFPQQIYPPILLLAVHPGG